MAANPELKEKVEEVLRENRVLLFMKGTPETPQCGFSMRVVGVLEQMGTEYGAIDVLPILDPLREVTGEISDWRTFPQLYVNGELVGGATSSRRCSSPASWPRCSASSSPRRPPRPHSRTLLRTRSRARRFRSTARSRRPVAT